MGVGSHACIYECDWVQIFDLTYRLQALRWLSDVG